MHDEARARPAGGRAACIRLLALPAALGSAAFVLVYSLAHYLLVIRLGWIDPAEEAVDLLGPILFAVGFGYFLLVPRVALLPLVERGQFAVAMVMSILAAVPAISAQRFVREAAARRLAIATLAEVTGQPARYYQIARLSVDQSRCGADRTMVLRGRGRRGAGADGLRPQRPVARSAAR
jgi:hypothetical protein